jgi:hypothetical protein
MKKQVTLFADEGMVITDGKTFGTTVSVSVDGDMDKYYEITKEEQEAILAEQERAILEGM